MNSLRLRTFNKYTDADIWYGSDTTPKRKSLVLERTHYNGAIAITDATLVEKMLTIILY